MWLSNKSQDSVRIPQLLKRKVRGCPFEPYINVSSIAAVKKFTRQCPHTTTFEETGQSIQAINMLMFYFTDDNDDVDDHKRDDDDDI